MAPPCGASDPWRESRRHIYVTNLLLPKDRQSSATERAKHAAMRAHIGAPQLTSSTSTLLESSGHPLTGDDAARRITLRETMGAGGGRYFPLASGRKSIATERPRLGIFISTLVDEYQTAVLAGAREAARARGAHLLCFVGGSLQSSGPRHVQRNRIFSLASRENIDALAIVAGSVAQECGAARLAEYCARFRELPMCTIAGELPGAASVAIDNQIGLRETVLHLIDVHRRRRIAFVRGPETNAEAQDRFKAYRTALGERGIDVDPKLIAPGEFSIASGARAVNLFFEQRQLIRNQGAAAVRLLLERLRGGAAEERIELPTAVVIRRSCGCFGDEVPLAPGYTRAPPSHSVFEAELIRRRQLMTAELSRAAQGSFMSVPGWNDLLIKSFIDQLQTRSDRFSKAFRSILDSLLDAGADIAAVHDVITVLRQQMLGCLEPDARLRERAENMFQDVRLVTSEAMERIQARRRAKAERTAGVLAATIGELATAGSAEELTAVVRKRFAELGITSCYVSLFDENDDQTARLLVGYEAEAPPVTAAQQIFRSALLAPDCWLNVDKSRCFAILSVDFDGEPLGLVTASLDGPIYVYDALGAMIG